MLGQPIFPGDSGVDQLVEIIKVLIPYLIAEKIRLIEGNAKSLRLKSNLRWNSCQGFFLAQTRVFLDPSFCLVFYPHFAVPQKNAIHE